MENFLNPRAVNARREAEAESGLTAPTAPKAVPSIPGGMKFAKPFTAADKAKQRQALAAKLRELAARDELQETTP